MPITQQMFIDAITTKGVQIVGDGNTNPDWINPRYAEQASVGTYPARRNPGDLEKFDGNGLPAAGFGPWGELSVIDLTPRNARVYMTGTLYSLSQAGVWTARVKWGGGLGLASHAFGWGGQWGTFSEGTSPMGWGRADQNGVKFMDAKSTWLGGNDRVREHFWPLSYTNVNGFFWTSVNPGSDTGLADRAKLADLLGLVSIMDFTVTGPDAAVAQYACSQGWDLYPENVNRTNPPLRPGSGSGVRLVKNGTTTMCSSLSRAQAATYGPALIALVNGATSPPPPSGDTVHQVIGRSTQELLVDGIVKATATSTTSAVNV